MASYFDFMDENTPRPAAGVPDTAGQQLPVSARRHKVRQQLGGRVSDLSRRTFKASGEFNDLGVLTKSLQDQRLKAADVRREIEAYLGRHGGSRLPDFEPGLAPVPGRTIQPGTIGEQFSDMLELAKTLEDLEREEAAGLAQQRPGIDAERSARISKIADLQKKLESSKGELERRYLMQEIEEEKGKLGLGGFGTGDVLAPPKDQQQPAAGATPNVGPPLTLDDVLAEGGMDYKRDFLPRAAEAVDHVERQGFQMDRPVKPGRFGNVLAGMLVALGPPGQAIAASIVGADQVQQKVAPPKKKGEGGKQEAPEQSPEMAMIDAEMKQKKAREQEIYKQLGATGGFQSVLDVLSYVLLSMTFGPKMAAQHMMALWQQGPQHLRTELDRIGNDLRMLKGEQLKQMRTETNARAMAARDLASNQRRQMAEEWDQYIDLQRLQAQRERAGKTDSAMSQYVKAYGAIARQIEQRMEILSGIGTNWSPEEVEQARQEMAVLKQRAADLADRIEAYARASDMDDGEEPAAAVGP